MALLAQLETWAQANTFLATLLSAAIISAFGLIVRGLWQHFRKNSARDRGIPPRDKDNDLHFLSMWKTGLYGRKEELSILKDFCSRRPHIKYSNISNPQRSFLWFLVTGEGGTGKSKLCYEFLRKMRWRGWTICMPEKTIEGLAEASAHLPNKTIFLLDYAEYDTKVIGEWIKKLEENNNKKRRISKRVRILLIQRRTTSGSLDGYAIDDSRYKYHRTENYRDVVQDKLALKPIADEEELVRMVRRYSKVYLKKEKRKTENTGKRKLTKDEAKETIDELKRVDVRKDEKGNIIQSLQRPLFANILAQAKCDGKPIGTRKDALDHIYAHEKSRYRKFLRYFYEQCGKPYTDEKEAAFFAILVIATIARQWQLDDVGINLLPPCFHKAAGELERLYKPPMYKNNPKMEFELFDYNRSIGITCNALEPDVVGGYFVLKCLEDLPPETRGLMISSAWTKTREVTQFVTRLYEDFEFESWFRPGEDKEQSWFNNIVIPSSLSVIARHAFLEYEYLHHLAIPKSVEAVQYSAFLNCRNLVSVTVEPGVKRIEGAAFEGCSALRIITIPDGVQIATGAFSKTNLNKDECSVPEDLSGELWPDLFKPSYYPEKYGGYKWVRLDTKRDERGDVHILLIANNVIEQKVFDSAVTKDMLLRGRGSSYSASTIRRYLNSDFKKDLKGSSGDMPTFHPWKLETLGDGEDIWLFSVDDIVKYFPSNKPVTDLHGTPSAWWTRTSAEDGTRARYVTEEGQIQIRKDEDDRLGLPVYNTCGLRPAFWLTD